MQEVMEAGRVWGEACIVTCTITSLHHETIRPVGSVLVDTGNEEIFYNQARLRVEA